MSSTLKLALSVWLALLSAQVAASPAFGQLCGGSFAKFVVTDSTGVKVSDATIELVAELPREEYLKHKTRKGNVEHGGYSFTLTAPEAEDLMTRAVPMTVDKDFCGNPLKQRAKSTPVKSREDVAKSREGSIDNFGFCTSEVFSRVYLLKISAAGYVTDYYIGRYLGGCWRSYSFVLTRSPDPKLSQSKSRPPMGARKGSAQRSIPRGSRQLYRS